MTWRALIVAAALLAGAVPFAPLAGQEVQVDPRLADRLPGPVADSVATEVDRALRGGLPTEPLVQRALEGASRGADGPRIIAAVRALRLRLEAAVAIMPDTDDAAPLVAAAAALGAGVPEEDVRTVVARSRSWGSPVAPLVLLADLVGRGVAPDSAVWAVEALGEAGVPTSAWTILPLQLDQDIADGASPSAAAATRVRGLILSRKDSGPSSGPRNVSVSERSVSHSAFAQPYVSGVSTYVAPGIEVPLGLGRETRLRSSLLAGAGMSRSHLGGRLSAATRVHGVSLELDAVLEKARWDGGEGSSGGGSVAIGLRLADLTLSGRAFGVAGSRSQVLRRDTVFMVGEYRFLSRRSTRQVDDWAELGGEVSAAVDVADGSLSASLGQVWAQVPGVPSRRTVAALSAVIPLPLGLELETVAGWGGVDPFLGQPPGTFLTAGFRWTRSVGPPDLELPDGPRAPPDVTRNHSRAAVERTTEGWTLTLHGVDAERVELMGDPTDWLPVPLEALGGGRWRVELRPAAGVQRILVRRDGGPWHPPPGLPRAVADYDPPPGLVVVP